MSEEIAQAAGDRAWAERLGRENAELRSLASRLNEQLRIADAEIAAYAERADKAETELAAAQAIIAGLRRSLAAANERAEQAEAKVAGLSLAADQYSVSRDAWMIKAKAAEERADKAEMERKAWTEIGAKAQADAEALRAAIWSAHFDIHYRHKDHWTWEECPKPTCYPLREALDNPNPGAALLAELADIRADLARLCQAVRASLSRGGIEDGRELLELLEAIEQKARDE